VRNHPAKRYTATPRSRTSALLQGDMQPVPVGSLWERTLCATNLRSDTPQRGCRAQGALPQTSRRGRQMEWCLKPMRSEALL